MGVTHQTGHFLHIVEFHLIRSQNSLEIRILVEECQHIVEHFATSLMLVHINELSFF